MTLQVRQIRKEFITRSGSLPVLCGIDLDLDSDKSLAIMGQSGSGKSTFLHVLGGLDKPSAGKILLDGLDPLAMNETDLAHYRNQKVGFVFQDHHLLPQCTVLENVLLPSLLGSTPKVEVIQLAKDLLARVGLENRMDHMPSELSGRLANRQWRNDWYAENKDFYCNYKDRAAKNQLTPFLIELARENCLDGDKIRAGDAVNFSIGQGDTVITPLKLTQMYAAIANGGKILRPSVAKAVVSTDGKVIKKISAKQLGTLPANQTTLNFLQGALREVVTAGTGTGAFAGFPIAISGKTGTAQVFGRNANGTLKADTSWFASYGPTQNPRYAVVMMVSQGGFGASVSGVGVRKIYETIFGVTGSKVDPAKAIFPDGKPPIKIPKISPSTKVKE